MMVLETPYELLKTGENPVSGELSPAKVHG